jgi:N-acetylneuraminic acid mutarotase
VKVESTRFPDLPEDLTSFGGAIADGKVYAYGGHTGDAHEYSIDEQSDRFWMLDLRNPTAWKELTGGPRLQGLALVAHQGKVIRVGGFTARNQSGEDQDLHSQSSVASYDPQSGTWTELAPLPEPRSSLDAAVLGDHVYVFGGWQLQGKKESAWHETAWSLDLSDPQAPWEALAKPPIRRRALSVAAYEGKLFVIGGMQPNNETTTRVDVYDPKTDRWSRGPDLLGEPINGFGTSAFAAGEHLFVTTINGDVQRLAPDGESWQRVGKVEPGRFFHRMLPLDDRQLLLVGGANMEIGKFTEIERIVIR